MNDTSQKLINLEAFSATNDRLKIYIDESIANAPSKVIIDSILSTTSKNPVENRIVAAEFDKYISKNGTNKISGNLEFTDAGVGNFRGIGGVVGTNDWWRIVGGSTAVDKGFLEIATSDNGNEPIYVRQYTSSSKFNKLLHSATLLDESGNTSFPGKLTTNGALFTNDVSISNASSPVLKLDNTSNGDVALILARGSRADWRILNSDGALIFQNNWTSSKTDYFSALTLNDNTGNALFKGSVTSPNFIGSLTGNATSAVKAQTADKWTTARTFTIGNTGKSVNGSANMAWSLSEIGAAPASGSTTISKLAETVTLGNGGSATILQDAATYRQKIEILDNSTAGDGVFRFSQSSDAGASWKILMTMNDDGNVIASKFTGSFVGNLLGNATSATKAVQDGNGNIIINKYVTLDTVQNISGKKTFTQEITSTYVNGFRIVYGGYGFIIRNDGTDTHFLLTNKGSGTDEYNSLRPFNVNNATGKIKISHGATIQGSFSSSGISTFSNTTDAGTASSGAVVISGGLGVLKQIVTNGKLFVGHSTASNAIIYLNNKQALKGTDTWLRINDSQAFVSGTYFGNGILRTDGILQVGNNGATLSASDSAVIIKKETTITSDVSITKNTPSTSIASGALTVIGGIGTSGTISAMKALLGDKWRISINPETESLEMTYYG